MESINANLNEEETPTILEAKADLFLKSPEKVDVLEEWEEEFVQRMFMATKSNRQNYTIFNAIKCTQYHTLRDKCFILVYRYLQENPPKRNGFIKYLITYVEWKKRSN